MWFLFLKAVMISQMMHFFETLKAYATEKGYKIGYVMWPIRTAVSGKQMTPGGATELMEVFGKEESIARIKKGIEKAF